MSNFTWGTLKIELHDFIFKIIEFFIAFMHKKFLRQVFKNTLKYLIQWNLFLRSGVDVVITIFCDFQQFSAKKLAFFSKTNVMIKVLHNLALF
jgi:hypothetical protein